MRQRRPTDAAWLSIPARELALDAAYFVDAEGKAGARMVVYLMLGQDVRAYCAIDAAQARDLLETARRVLESIEKVESGEVTVAEIRALAEGKDN